MGEALKGEAFLHAVGKEGTSCGSPRIIYKNRNQFEWSEEATIKNRHDKWGSLMEMGVLGGTSDLVRGG